MIFIHMDYVDRYSEIYIDLGIYMFLLGMSQILFDMYLQTHVFLSCLMQP